jgi:hypothetical protein
MSIGNLQDYGNKGNNFPWQLKMLKGLQGIIDNLLLLVYPLGQRVCDDSVSTTLCTDQANVLVTPGINSVVGIKDMGFYIGATSKLLTLSIYNQDTTNNILVSIDAGSSYVPVPKGVTINYDAGGLLNYFDPTQIFIDQNTATSYPLIIYTYI